MIFRENKKIGETCLEFLLRVNMTGEKATYAGRLDPLARGEMIILTGDDVHKKEQYLHKRKSYKVTIIQDIQTDTHDILGLPELFQKESQYKNINEIPKSFDQPYPYFSSKAVSGRPLWQWYREGRIAEIEIPTKHVHIYSIKKIVDSHKEIFAKELLKNIEQRIDTINPENDFRQDEIKKAWQELLGNSDHVFRQYQFRCICSSGTYMRSLCHVLGGTAFEIYRESIAEEE